MTVSLLKVKSNIFQIQHTIRYANQPCVWVGVTANVPIKTITLLLREHSRHKWPRRDASRIDRKRIIFMKLVRVEPAEAATYCGSLLRKSFLKSCLSASAIPRESLERCRDSPLYSPCFPLSKSNVSRRHVYHCVLSSRLEV